MIHTAAQSRTQVNAYHVPFSSHNLGVHMDAFQVVGAVLAFSIIAVINSTMLFVLLSHMFL